MWYTKKQEKSSSERNRKVNISEKNKKRIHLGVGIAVSVMLVLVGILFMTSCYSIYKSGQSPFTYASISEAFSKIAVWVYMTISLVIIGAAVLILLPVDEGKLKGTRSPEVLVKKFAERVNVKKIDTELSLPIEKERKLRRVLLYIRCAIITLSAILPLIYILNPANFPAVSGQYNAEISHGMLLYLAFLSPMIVFEVVYVIVSDLSLNREYELLKKAIAENGISAATQYESPCVIAKAIKFIKKNEKPIILGVRIAFVGCAVAFIAMGIANGGMADVLNKAINICTECIGLG